MRASGGPTVVPRPWIANGARALVETGEIDLHVAYWHLRRARVSSTAASRSMFGRCAAGTGGAIYRLDRKPFHSAHAPSQPDLVRHGRTSFLHRGDRRPPNVISMQAVMGSSFGPTRRSRARGAAFNRKCEACDQRSMACYQAPNSLRQRSSASTTGVHTERVSLLLLEVRR